MVVINSYIDELSQAQKEESTRKQIFDGHGPSEASLNQIFNEEGNRNQERHQRKITSKFKSIYENTQNHDIDVFGISKPVSRVIEREEGSDLYSPSLPIKLVDSLASKKLKQKYTKSNRLEDDSLIKFKNDDSQTYEIVEPSQISQFDNPMVSNMQRLDTSPKVVATDLYGDVDESMKTFKIADSVD